MRTTRAALVAGLAVAAVACGYPEQRVVDQYFGALSAGDNDTLTSFAAVTFDKKVTDWKILSVTPEVVTPAELPELAKKVSELDAELAANKKAGHSYQLDNFQKIDEVRSLETAKKPIPPGLKPIADKWKELNETDAQLKRAVADAKRAVDKEKRLVALSIGTTENAETLAGQMLSKDVDLQLTIDGQPQPYLMQLRKYDVSGGEGPRTVSRWFVLSLKPKS